VALALLAASLLIRVPRPDREGRDVQFDAELGWAPALPPGEGNLRLEGTVGQRRQVYQPGRPSILMVGDSVTYAQGLGESETPAAHLDRLLPGHQVLNLGVTGYSLDQYYLYLKRLLPRLEARLVVVNIFTPNDYQGTTVENYYGYAKPLFRLREGALVLANTPLSEASCSHRLTHSLLFYPLWRWGAANRDQGGRERVLQLASRLCFNTRLGRKEGDGVVEGLLKEVVRLARSRGAETLFVLLPNQHNLADPHGLEQLDKFPWPTLRFFRDLLGQLKYDTLDFARELSASGYCQRHSAADGCCDYDALYLDGGHMTARGSELLAGFLKRRIVAEYGLR